MRTEPAVPAEALSAIRAPFASAGAERADAPLLQPLSLLLDLAGEDMRQRLFVVQAEGGAEYCLRPDFTVAIARRHLESGAAAGRYLYEGAAFRAEPDSDGAEEFLQIGLEVFEPAHVAPLDSEIEVTALAWRAAQAGGRQDLTLWLGDVGLFSAFVDGMELPPTLAARLKRAAGRPRLLQAELARAGQDAQAPGGGQLASMLAGLPQAQAVALLEETWALAGIEPVGGRGPAEIAERLVRRAAEAAAPSLSLAQADAVRRFLAISASPRAALADVRILSGPGRLGEALEAWGERLRRLEAAGVPEERIRLATALGHAFDYYDGLTLEIRTAALERPIAVGGRYDSLLPRLGAAAEVRAMGCMVRPWRAFAGGRS